MEVVLSATTSSLSPAAVLRTGVRVVAGYVRARPRAFAVALFGSILFSAAVVSSSLVLGWVTDELIVPVLGNGRADVAAGLAVAMIVGVGVAKAIGITLRRAAAAALLIGAAVIIAVTDVWMGVAAVIWLIASLLVNIRGSWRMARLGQMVQRLRGDVAATAHESFDGALTG